MRELSLRIVIPRQPWEDFASSATKAVLRPVQILIAAPSFLFLAALTVMLLRPPDVNALEVDRIGFGLLVVGVVGRAIVLRQPLFRFERVTWPMLGLTLLALVSVASQPFDIEAWSVLAAKFLVPFAFFHLATLVFNSEPNFRQFELYALVVLAYLSFTAIAFLAGARSLIFPSFILDESIGFHADRARGPFLQAVANGVSLNLLGLLAWHAYQRGSARGVKIFLLLASVPVAILATMTRAVWLTFAGTILTLILFSRTHRAYRLCIAAILMAGFGLIVTLSSNQFGESLGNRLEERGPIEYREAVYAGGWEMFLQRPWTGWGFHQMPAELPRHVSGYHERVLYPHNTYLELLVEQGLLGLAFYVWLMWEMWRLGRGEIPPQEKSGFLGQNFHRLWPVFLAVYWVNAAAVVMSYQFVNCLLYSLAGMLTAQRRRLEATQLC